MFCRNAVCCSTPLAGLRRNASGLFPVVPKRLPFCFTALGTYFGFGTGGALPFVFVRRQHDCAAGTERDAEKEKAQDVTQEFLDTGRHGRDPRFSVVIPSGMCDITTSGILPQ